MKVAIAALVGSVLGGFLAVVLGVSSAIREANDRAAEATELANTALATSERQANDLRLMRTELEGKAGK